MQRTACASSIVALTLITCCAAFAEFDGSIARNGIREFPLGFYELPDDEAALRAVADAGVNIVRCNSRNDLDRAHNAGLAAWVPLPLDAGPTDALRSQIEAVKDHPALAVWEGPDEVVWNFTAYSGLHKTMGVYTSPDEWWQQTPRAIRYSEDKAAAIIPNMHASIAMIRSLDSRGLPVWMNEALKSDVKFVRQYLPAVDVVGCDIYPVSGKERRIERMGGATERWKAVSKGKPVWMVMQAFSWDELGPDYANRGTAYPSFAESRFMAYDVIAHGGRGLMYWGSQFLQSDACRRSIYAVISELAALRPFLLAPSDESVRVRLVELPEESQGLGVAYTARQADGHRLIVLVNEDDAPHMGVEVSGLADLNGRDLFELYGEETARVNDGEFITRLTGRGVKVFATTRDVETPRRDGRDYMGQ